MHSTTLSTIINGILEEKRRLTENDTTSELAHAALEKAARKRGRPFCNNCRREGHISANCYDKGGAKEGQAPWQKKKKKSKEKAHTTYGGGEDSGEDVNSSFIKFEQSTVTEITHILYSEEHLSSPNPRSTETPGVKHLAYIASTAKLHPIIIDSGTSSHIHSNPAHFV